MQEWERQSPGAGRDGQLAGKQGQACLPDCNCLPGRWCPGHCPEWLLMHLLAPSCRAWCPVPWQPLALPPQPRAGRHCCSGYRLQWARGGERPAAAGAAGQGRVSAHMHKSRLSAGLCSSAAFARPVKWMAVCKRAGGQLAAASFSPSLPTCAHIPCPNRPTICDCPFLHADTRRTATSGCTAMCCPRSWQAWPMPACTPVCRCAWLVILTICD